MRDELRSLQALGQLREFQREQKLLQLQAAKRVLDGIDQELSQLKLELSRTNAWFSDQSRLSFSANELSLVNHYTSFLRQRVEDLTIDRKKAERDFDSNSALVMKAQIAVDQTEYRTKHVLKINHEAQLLAEWRAADELAVIKPSLLKVHAYES